MNTREKQIELFKELLQRTLNDVDHISRMAQNLNVVNEQYFLDWQDSLNKYSVDNVDYGREN